VRVVPLTLAQANEFVELLHRHHKKVQGHRFSLGAETGGKLVGACIVGRPVAWKTAQYRVAEVTRLVTDGTKNACSFLYGAAARVAREMGFDSIQTFILITEPGTSLAASGWRRMNEARNDGKRWNSRPGRREDTPAEPKVRWAKHFKEAARGGDGAGRDPASAHRADAPRDR
jgi:hypothetical protein